ncbi:MAG: C1 family peptidase [Edaphobacter sp.]|uniref:C1 family peptidase n=1 Tax=Edaphobacter sp. TaxID=1934404 RepID=UPI00239CB48C|nr:C1 family peptidase [Edaphobacter sp.]MDE1178696.1 C1 family peptidase [Edaphobacter sp.]
MATKKTSPAARKPAVKAGRIVSKTKRLTARAKKPTAKPAADRPLPKTNVVPDAIDLRDRPYMPSVMLIPAQMLLPRLKIPVLNQQETSACTGFALSSVIFHLQHKAKRDKRQQAVSPFMLYSMARRYDEFPGDPTKDTGSSLRGAMKGWFKYGACAAPLWQDEDMPAPVKNPAKDWWQDAVKRPLGAYYRVDTRSVTDMQVALNEIGVLYASAVVHSGWMEGVRPHRDPKVPFWIIPQRKRLPGDGAHAFAIVGYNRDGFIVHNSWDMDWGTGGRAVLTYQDWTDNAMDCWVAQLGVPTHLHQEIAEAKTLRTDAAGQVQLASDETLRNREIAPYIIDMENNGRLSNTGDFRTQDSDVDWLLNEQIKRVRDDWKLPEGAPMDIAIYAHGGLTSENGAAATAASWIPAMYEKQIYPIF